MNDRPYRQTSVATTWSAAVFVLMVAGVGVVVSGHGGDVAFALVIVLAFVLLFSHSVELRVDRHDVEVRMGNGWLRRSVPLSSIRDWHVDDARVWGAGLRRADGARRIGLGAPQTLYLHTVDETLSVGLTDAADAAAVIRARLDELTADAGDEE